jgi:hypothetical protein
MKSILATVMSEGVVLKLVEGNWKAATRMLG